MSRSDTAQLAAEILVALSFAPGIHVAHQGAERFANELTERIVRNRQKES